MKPAPKDLDQWLSTATRGLKSSVRERLKLELSAHYHDACEERLRAGFPADEAQQLALEALGDVHLARKTYLEEYAHNFFWSPPAKPEEHEFGYLKRDRLIPCSREELISRCRSSSSQPHFAWTPDAATLVPIQKIPFLFAAIKHERIQNARIQLVCMVAVAAFTLGDPGSADLFKDSWRHLVLWLIGFGVFPAGIWLVQLRKAQALTPEILDKEADEPASLARFQALRGRCLMTNTITILLLLGAAGSAYFAYAGGHSYQVPLGLSPGLTDTDWFWRHLTSIVSGGPLETIFTMLGLIWFGSVVETFYSRWMVPFIFVSSGLFGGWFHAVFGSGMLNGATAGIAGLFGFLFIAPENQSGCSKRFLASLLLGLAFFGVIGFDVFDNAAHLGGLICGLQLGDLFVRKSSTSFPIRVGGAIALGCLAAGAFSAVYIHWKLWS